MHLPHLCHPIRKYYAYVLVVAAALAGVGAYYTSKLKLDSDLAALLPDSFQSVQALKRMEGEVGGTSQLRIALKTQDFSAGVALADRLAQALVESEYVGSVDYRNDVDFYERHALLFLDVEELDSLYDAIQRAIDKEKQAINPFMVDDLFGPAPGEAAEGGDDLAEWEEKYSGELPTAYYVNADSTVLVLSVNPAESGANIGTSQRMVADVRRIVDSVQPTSFAPDMEVYYGGNVKNRVDELDAISRDVLGTGVLGVTGVLLLLVVFYRRLVVPLLISLSLLPSMAWTFGLTYLFIGQLNTITAFLFVVLFGMGIEVGIHGASRYLESRQAGLDPEGALHRMVCMTGAAQVTAAATTSAAFFALMIFEFRGFSELGLIVGIGIIFSWLAMAVVLPAMFVLAERVGLMRVKVIPGKSLTGDGRPFAQARHVVAAAAAATLVLGYLFTQVTFQYDFTNLRIITPEREEYARVTTGVFTRSESPAIVVTDSREEVEEVVEAVREVMRTDTLSPTVESVRSILSVVPANQEAKIERIRLLRTLVEEEALDVVEGEDKRRVDKLMEFLSVDQPFGWEDFPVKDRGQFSNKQGEPGNFVLIYPGVALRDGRNAMAFRDDIGTIVTKSGKEFHAGSSNLIVADMLSMVGREGPLAAMLALSVVFTILLIDFRNLKAVLFIMTPLVGGVLWMGGLMYVFGMQLNFFNVVVFPSIIGIGDDSGVHIYHRYMEEGRRSIPFIMRRTGLAVVLTTACAAMGYSGLLGAHHPGLQSIGYLAIVGLVTTLITAFFVLPALLEVFDSKKGVRRRECLGQGLESSSRACFRAIPQPSGPPCGAPTRAAGTASRWLTMPPATWAAAIPGIATCWPLWRR
ncbi:MAG: MMPL family transporter [Longimicrobiales bacterium]|nr:MMPL family transporter [Longimicrobiales bacterium]